MVFELPAFLDLRNGCIKVKLFQKLHSQIKFRNEDKHEEGANKTFRILFFENFFGRSFGKRCVFLLAFLKIPSLFKRGIKGELN